MILLHFSAEETPKSRPISTLSRSIDIAPQMLFISESQSARESSGTKGAFGFTESIISLKGCVLSKINLLFISLSKDAQNDSLTKAIRLFIEIKFDSFLSWFLFTKSLILSNLRASLPRRSAVGKMRSGITYTSKSWYFFSNKIEQGTFPYVVLMCHQFRERDFSLADDLHLNMDSMTFPKSLLGFRYLTKQKHL